VVLRPAAGRPGGIQGRPKRRKPCQYYRSVAWRRSMSMAEFRAVRRFGAPWHTFCFWGGGEGGIRTLDRPMAPLTYRLYIAGDAGIAVHAADNCPRLP
jgi:hypothetical protein